MTRAKFECESVTETTWAKSYKFRAVTSGSPENEAFFKTTPTGTIEIAVKNPEVSFTPGKKYYVDFTPAD